MKKLGLAIVIVFLIASFSRKEKQWVALGDSITYLNDHLNETGNRVTKGYMTRVVEKFPDIRFINKGYNGWTAGGIAKEINNLEIPRADIYTVFLGTNDWWAGRPVGTINDYINNSGNETFYGSYRIIIDKLRSLNNKSTIILITPLQRTDFVYIENLKNNAYGSYKEKAGQSLSQFADAIDEIAKREKLKVVDLYYKSGITIENSVRFKRLKDQQTGAYRNYHYPDYIGVPFNPESDEYPYPPESIDMTYDGLHPSDKGYEVISKMLIEVLKR